jgi:hypothetical protein
MVEVVDWMCLSKGRRPAWELAPVLKKAPNHFSDCLANLHPVPGNSQSIVIKRPKGGGRSR